MYAASITDRGRIIGHANYNNRQMLRNSVRIFTRNKLNWYMSKVQADGIADPHARRVAQLKVDQDRLELRESGRILNRVIGDFERYSGVEVRARCTGLSRTSHLTSHTLARDLRQPLEKKGVMPIHAMPTGEPDG